MNVNVLDDLVRTKSHKVGKVAKNRSPEASQTFQWLPNLLPSHLEVFKKLPKVTQGALSWAWDPGLGLGPVPKKAGK